MKSSCHQIIMLSALYCWLFAFIPLPCLAQESKMDDRLNISKAYANDIAKKIDRLVNKHFFDRQKVKTIWQKNFKVEKANIEKCSSLIELSEILNRCLKALNTSHCQFLTYNDETLHFLESLFDSFKNKSTKLYLGFKCGGAGLKQNQVRYILDKSPAAIAGIKYGDIILSVDGEKYYGYSNFLSNKKKSYKLKVSRLDDKKQKLFTLSLKPDEKTVYSGYAEATEKSARLIKQGNKRIGYIHMWSGGEGCHQALDEALESKLKDTDGLIFDLRDGYGGNSLDDLDRFYRSPKNYPDFVSRDRSGKTRTYRYYYNKPVVAIINGGARSGKELLAFSLKRSGRATLVGEKTKGAVVAGRYFKVDKNTSLYLAVQDGTAGGVRLEGKGVAPDLEIVLDRNRMAKGEDNQLAKAIEALTTELN